MAGAASDDASRRKDRKVSEMSPDEKKEAMGIRTLPNGKTIGHKPVGGYDWRPEDLPDFIGARFGGGKIGYVRKTDAFAEYFRPPTENVDELIEHNRQRLREGPKTIPVFADDGETVIGEKVVGGGGATGVKPDGTTVTYDYGKGAITTVNPDGTTTVENLRE